MKGFFTFAVILALALVGYISYPAAMDFFRSQNWLPAGTEKPVATSDGKPDKPATEPEAPAEVPVPVAPKTPVAPPPAPPVITSPADDEVARLIPMPNIRSLEEITANWTNVPERAFPPKVTLKEGVSFELVQGNTMPLDAGKEVTPIALAADGTLTVAPRAGSILKTTIAVEKTDFKDRVTERYNEGVERIKQGIQARRDQERVRLANAATTSEEVKAQAGEVPKTTSDEERYLALMKTSVANGELKDVTPDKVKNWRWLGYEEVDGTGYWTGAAIILKETYFGMFETEAKAYIRQGKVEKWTLPGLE